MVTPAPGSQISIPYGSYVFRFENDGSEPVLLTRIAADHEIKPHPAVDEGGLRLNPGSFQDIFIEFEGAVDVSETGAIEIQTNVGTALYPYTVVTPPQLIVKLEPDEDGISLNTRENHYFYTGDQRLVPCEVALDAGDEVLFGVRLYVGDKSVQFLPNDSLLSHWLKPEDPFRFRIDIPTDKADSDAISENAEEIFAQLELEFQLRDSVVFPITFQKYVPGRLIYEFTKRFIDDDAIVTTAKSPRDFQICLGNAGEGDLRIDAVQPPTVPWLHLPNPRQVNCQIVPKVVDLKSPDAFKFDLQILPHLLPNREEAERLRREQMNHSQSEAEGGRRFRRFGSSASRERTSEEVQSANYIVRGGEVVIDYTHLVTGRRDQLRLPVGLEVREPETLEKPLAIDFGTTNTVAAFMPNGRTVIHLVELDAEHELDSLASCLRFKKHDPNGESPLVETGQIIYDGRFGGLDAVKSTAWGWKRFLGRPPEFKIARIDGDGNPDWFHPVDFTALFFRELIARFEETHPYKVDRILLTFPEAFGEEQRHQLEESARQIGYKAKVFISEPHALAFEYIYHEEIKELKLESDEDEKFFGIFDFGGGTTDITIAKIRYSEEEDDVEIVPLRTGNPHYGNTRLGGDFLTYLIAQRLHQLLLSSRMFRMGSEFQFDLDNSNLSENLRAEFEANGITLSENAIVSVEEPNRKWLVTDLDNSQTYVVQNEVGQLSVFEEINASAETQIEVPFPEFEAMMAGRAEEDETLNYSRLGFEAERLKIENYFALARQGSLSVQLTNLIQIERDKDGNFINRDYLNEEITLTHDDFNAAVESVIREGFEFFNAIVFQLYEEGQIPEMELDVLILAGNSSLLPLVKAIADEEVPARRIYINPENCKLGVARGTLTAYHLGGMASAAKISYPIGCEKRGRFQVLFSSGQLNPQSPPKASIVLRKVSRWDHLTIYINTNPTNISGAKITDNPDIREIAKIWLPMEQVRGKGVVVMLSLIAADRLQYQLFVNNPASDSGQLLFSTDPPSQTDLDNNHIPKTLREAFESHGAPLSQDATVSVEKGGSRWLITCYNQGNTQAYTVKKEIEEINVYACKLSPLGETQEIPFSWADG